MAKPNFKFQKRQKELEKKKKNEEKMQRKLERTGAQPTEDADRLLDEGATSPPAANLDPVSEPD